MRLSGQDEIMSITHFNPVWYRCEVASRGRIGSCEQCWLCDSQTPKEWVHV